ncbi:MAG: glycoside hydrolase family 116 protein, partial [Tannerella sp.]|nr:glycoside hydrolase family 116 protein [Tannerella sp.]
MRIIRFYTLLVVFLSMGIRGYSITESSKIIDGYPLANFALTVNVSENGDFFGHILQNSGRLGSWLSDKGAVVCYVEKGNERHPFSLFGEKQVERTFPFVEGLYRQSPVISAEIRTVSFCPLGINDPETSSLPTLLLEINCLNPTGHEEFMIKIKPDQPLVNQARLCKSPGYSGIVNEAFQLTSDAETTWENGELGITVTLQPAQQKKIRVLLTFFDKDWTTVNRFDNIEEVTNYTYNLWSVLKEKNRLFSEAIPETGDKELDTYLRWYMIPGISLTKCTKEDEVLTMGYRELNQRDSYWTSWIHLVLFKDLEKKMIEESIAAQQPSGKIPTTILPLIEREDDLDINAFFVLRVARFYQMYHNKKELLAYWPSLKAATDWLLSRDTNGNGLPVQVSFWGDWKDVGGVEGRMYSPFSGLTYLSALRQMIFLSKECSDEDSRRKYEAAYEKGFGFINKPVEEGGLWNGRYYCQIWKDGSVNDKLLQDQTIGILFDVVPRERALSIIASLNEKSLTDYGICETYPYYPASFGYAPATYHNGAVWPWLSFMDCWARIHAGK